MQFQKYNHPVKANCRQLYLTLVDWLYEALLICAKMILTALVTVVYGEVLIKEAMDLPEKRLLISEGATMYNEWSLSFEEGH